MNVAALGGHKKGNLLDATVSASPARAQVEVNALDTIAQHGTVRSRSPPNVRIFPMGSEWEYRITNPKAKMDFSFINLLQRDWAIGPSGTPKEGDPPTCLMLCPAKDFPNVPDDTLMESAISGEKKTKAEVAKMDDESRFSVFASAEILAWGIRPEPQKGVFFNGKFVETQ